MEVYTAHSSLNLIEADIIEPFEAGTWDRPYSMVGNKERFFPSHEYMFTLGEVAVCEIRSFGLFSQRTPGGKPRPMVQVCLFRGAPFLITSLESVFGADHFSFKKGSQGRVIFC